VTTTVPVVAQLGTGTTMLVPLQLVGVPAVPLNFTVLVPCVAPKFVPVIVTEVPTDPDVGFRLAIVMDGLGVLAPPPFVACAQPCSTVATANNEGSQIKRLRKVVQP
jgi:hypothetical protein